MYVCVRYYRAQVLCPGRRSSSFRMQTGMHSGMHPQCTLARIQAMHPSMHSLMQHGMHPHTPAIHPCMLQLYMIMPVLVFPKYASIPCPAPPGPQALRGGGADDTLSCVAADPNSRQHLGAIWRCARAPM